MPPLLLALDTATDVCSVALFAEGAPMAEVALRRPRAHAENLVPMVQDALRYADVEAAAIEAVAVSMGPGSYTGLRIGVSTAKGLAFATGAALYGVPTLEALAHQASATARSGVYVVAALNARRDEVYAGGFRVGDEGLAEVAETTALHTHELPAWLGAVPGVDLLLVGDGAAKSERALVEAGHRVRVLPPDASPPLASAVARRALDRIAHTPPSGTPDDLATFEPFYLKDFVARRPVRSPLDRLSF